MEHEESEQEDKRNDTSQWLLATAQSSSVCVKTILVNHCLTLPFMALFICMSFFLTCTSLPCSNWPAFDFMCHAFPFSAVSSGILYSFVSFLMLPALFYCM